MTYGREDEEGLRVVECAQAAQEFKVRLWAR